MDEIQATAGARHLLGGEQTSEHRGRRSRGDVWEEQKNGDRQLKLKVCMKKQNLSVLIVQMSVGFGGTLQS